MSQIECIPLSEDWEGYRICGWERFLGAESEKRWMKIVLEPRAEHVGECSGCGRKVKALHESSDRLVRDLPIFECPVVLQVPRRRLECPNCGPKLEKLSWLSPYARVTKRLGESVSRLCTVMPIKHVAELYGLSWDVVKEIDKGFLKKRFEGFKVLDVEFLAVDEFALHRGHRYATVVVEPLRRRVLWVGKGRSRESVRPFLEELGEEGRRKLKAVAMDMNSGYELEFRKWCPQIEVVFDFFHVVAKYGREVLGRVRVDEANRLRHDKPARKLVKGSRWILLKNRGNLNNHGEEVRLRELLKANRALCTAYILRDDLKQLFRFRQKAAALRFWKGWYRRAIRSRLAPLVRFAKQLKPYLPGLLAHCRYPLGTSFLEGMNNKIKVIKRMAYGFRDEYYFFLKIRAAFPGIPG